MADPRGNGFNRGRGRWHDDGPARLPVTIDPATLGWQRENGCWRLNGHELTNRQGWWIIYAAGNNGKGQMYASAEALVEATKELDGAVWPEPVEATIE